MTRALSRREFLAASAAAAALTAAGPLSAKTFKTHLHKAMIVGKPTREGLMKLKAAGFEGVEAHPIPADQAAECRKLAESLHMRVHSVMRGWAEFNSPDPKAVEKSFEYTEFALRAAQAYGADTILLVPCRVGGKGMAIPEPWEFDIAFDDKTGHVTRVVAGDNGKYKAYIDAQNRATDASIREVRKLIPLAKKTGIIIALENVWNNLWVKPALAQHFIASFDSPWVRSYFDIGNHVKYAPPQEWIHTLGSLIVKCHVKGFKLNANGHGGRFVPLRQGSINWPAVRQALDDVNYNGWLSIEENHYSLKEYSHLLDLIIAGK